MNITEQVELGIVIFLIISIWGSIKLVVFIKKRNINVELCATIFEGMTQNLVDLKLLKAPESFIEKKSSRNGQEKDSDTDGI